jgi:hypothetical protein
LFSKDTVLECAFLALDPARAFFEFRLLLPSRPSVGPSMM